MRVTDGEEDYGCTQIEIRSDIDTLNDFFHKAIQKEPLQMLSILLGSNMADKQDIERDLTEILQEKPFNPAFLHLLERLLRLQPTDGKFSLLNYHDTMKHFVFCQRFFKSVCAAIQLGTISVIMLTHPCNLYPSHPTFS